MKILYLCQDLGIPVLGPKGAAVHVRRMVSAFSRAGHSVTLATPVLSKSALDQRADLDAALWHLPASGEARAAGIALKRFNEALGASNSLPGQIRSMVYNRELEPELERRLEIDPHDLIYERASLYGIAGAQVAQSLGIARVAELNAPLALEHSRYRGNGLGDLGAQAELWALRQAGAVLAVSAPLRGHLLSLGLDPEAVHVVPNGVDAERFRPGPSDPGVRVRFGLGEGPVLGFVGGLRPWHGVEALPRLLERLVPRYPALRLFVVGDGPLREELSDELERRGMLQNVVFTGFLPHEEIPALIRTLDIGLAPYSQPEHLWYASPLKVFEYMACGVPVVAANLGQTVEIVRHGENGLLYDHEDLEELAAACERLLDDPGLRSRLGATAAREIRDRYTWERNAARVEELARALTPARIAAG